MSLFFDLVPGLILAALAVWFYFHIIKSKMAETAVVTRKADVVAASSGAGKVWAILQGWKTIILAWLAAVVNGLAATPHILACVDENLLKAWQALPWTSVFDAKVASYVNFGIALMIPLAHSFGLNQAAKTPPQAN